MTISPETLAEQMLGHDSVGKKNTKGLFLKDAVVAIFDGLVIFRGDLNMVEAIPRLQAMSTGIGLPIAVIEKQVFKGYNKNKNKIGKHIGPGNWMLCSWNTEEGFDFGLKEKYNSYGIEKDAEENEKTSRTTAASAGNLRQPIDRSHLSTGNTFPPQHRARSHNSSFYEDEDIWDETGGWCN